MIRGHFVTVGLRRHPVMDAILNFLAIGRSLEVRFLVDTGADRTVLGAVHAERLRTHFGLDLTTLHQDQPSVGVGGQVSTRMIEALIALDNPSLPVTLPILDALPARVAIPSLLGRDILAHFALFLEERTGQVLLLEPDEADALHLP